MRSNSAAKTAESTLVLTVELRWEEVTRH